MIFFNKRSFTILSDSLSRFFFLEEWLLTESAFPNENYLD